MPIVVDVQYASDTLSVPAEEQILDWTRVVLKDLKEEVEFTIRIVDAEEATELNERWRKSAGPTNVLSFPADGLEDISPELLGDIVICAPVIETEAKTQGKTLNAHWAHMIVHGILHLLGYDHINTEDADTMETLEIEILDTLGYENPYI